MKRWLIFLLLAGLSQAAFAQKYPERSEIRAGNKSFAEGEYEASSLYYLRALEKTPGSVEAFGNLAGALYRQEQYEEAAKLGEKIARDSSAGQYASQLFYNAGNAHFQQRKLEEAIEAYKNALRRNPYDQEAKFNLAYAQKLRDQDKNDGGGGGGGDNNQDQNDQNNQDNQNDQNQENDNNQDNKDNQNQDQQNDQNNSNDQNQDDQKDQQDPQQGDGQGQPPPTITPQQADQMLNAMQEADDKTKEKVDAQAVKAAGPSGKNW